MLICHLYIFFGEVSVKVFGSFFNRVASSLWSFEFFVLFWVTVLYQMCLLQNIFSQSVVCRLSHDIVFCIAEVYNLFFPQSL